MEMIALLRGVTPTGKNRISKMSELVTNLSNAGFNNVRTYIQSGNIIIDSNLSRKETSMMIHSLIFKHIRADLAVIIKSKAQVKRAITNNPFKEGYNQDRVHLVFTDNKIVDTSIDPNQFFDEELRVGNEFYYLYLPFDARKKKLNTVYLECWFGLVATMRKLNAMNRLISL